MRKPREVAIYVRRGDAYLVAHRPNDDIWNVIAGQVEDGESFADAAARELMEEAALASPLRDLELRQWYDVPEPFRHLYAPGEYRVEVRSYLATAPAGWEPTLNHEHDSYRWCTFDEAIAILHWPEVKEGLRVAARH
jgi:8-oxo-dGTP pyrophosphatase MutT (NUDIX family)